MKPIIGILGNLSISELDPDVIERVFLNNAYIEAVLKAKGVPLIIPVNTDEEIIERQIELVDGLVLSGGIDVNPNIYQEEPTKDMGQFHPDVDEFDLIAIRVALENKKPILGICRGMQVLNVAQGGTLYQDITHIEGSYIKHSQETKPYMPTHKITIKKESKLYDILGSQTYVNSYHHQSVKKLGDNLINMAESEDGVIEAIEMKDKEFVVGVQWHPERMVNHDKNMLKLFEKFIDVCKDNGTK